MPKKQLIDSFLGQEPAQISMPQSKEISAASKKKGYTRNSIFSDPDRKTETESRHTNHSTFSDNVVFISPRKIKNWEYHDRMETSYGDIDTLAKEFRQIGQQQPCIVRKSHDGPDLYELIIGERRWRAAQKAGVDLMVIIKNIDDKNAALAQAAENDNRENLSDYEKGMSLSRLIGDGIIKQKDLTEKLGKSKQYISALLSFSKIPEDILHEIGDITQFSAVSAERIKQISSRDAQHKEALLAIGNKFKGKSPSAGQIEKEIAIEISKKDKIESFFIKKLYTKDGRHIGTWRLNNNGLPALNIPSGIYKLIESNQIDIDDLSNEIIKVIDMKLNKLRK